MSSKIAFVTGATSGMGLSCAQKMQFQTTIIKWLQVTQNPFYGTSLFPEIRLVQQKGFVALLTEIFSTTSPDNGKEA